MKNKKEIQSLFERKKELVKEVRHIGQSLDSLIFEQWGFSYSLTDDDRIIDSLDYGTSDITFEDFVSLMNSYKKDYKKGIKKPRE